MPIYDFKALDAKGKNIKGIIDADNPGHARSLLRSQGKFPTSILEGRQRQKRSGRGGFTIAQRIKSEEISVVTRQLATLLGAGVPLVQAIESIQNQTKNNSLKKVLSEIRGAVNEGASLTDALGVHPRLFSSVYTNMVRAGEASGSLDVVLERLADFAEKEQELKAKLRASLVYPVFMAVIGSAILLILITYIVPNITQVFADMEKALPLPTLVLIGLSDALKAYWWLLLGGAILLIVALRAFIQRPLGRRGWDYCKLRVIIIGPVVQKVILARFASTLGSLLDSGVSVMDSMKIVQTLVDNVHIADVIEQSMEQIRKGQSMANTLSDSPWFPPMFVQMIGIGEQSGSLEKMLKKVSKAYEREVETSIMAMTSLIEPIMIAVMGLAVGCIVLSILLPIFEMNQMIG